MDGVIDRHSAKNLWTGSNEKLQSEGFARFYVLLNNVSKKQNVGTLMRSACAFGVREILIAGSPKNTQYFGAMGTNKHVPVTYFESMEKAVEYARENGCKICGVEIKDEAKNILEDPFEPNENIAFMLGNEGQGMSDKQCSFCDFFVYIPHYGDGTASLNVAVAASIVFQRFASWAQYPERVREKEKFVVKDAPMQSGAETEMDMKRQELRKQKKQEAAASQSDFLDGASLFGTDE